jgi:hypothetical protein
MEDKLFDLMSKMYGEFSEFRKETNERFDKIENRLTGVEDRLTGVEKTVLKIEQDHGEKLSALFDGYVQNTNKLDRIEDEVKKHDEVILRRVK